MDPEYEVFTRTFVKYNNRYEFRSGRRSLVEVAFTQDFRDIAYEQCQQKSRKQSSVLFVQNHLKNYNIHLLN